MKQSYYFNNQQFYELKERMQLQLSASKQSLVLINLITVASTLQQLIYFNKYEE